MKRIKKTSSKSTKNFVTVGFVLTVAAVVMYLLSLLTDGVLLAQLATLKNFIENGTWAPQATRIMSGMLEKCKNIRYTEATVKILSALTEENRAQIQALAKEICNG